MKAKELRNKSVNELSEELMALLKEQFNLRITRSTNQNLQSHLFKKAKKEIARIKTILKEKEGSLI